MTLSQIRALAEEYARQFNPDSVAPFPHQNIEEKFPDLEIYFAELEDPDVSGATLYKDEKFIILININNHPTRQHFTLGHELGHYFLHQEILKREKGIMDGEDVLDGNVLFRLDNATTQRIETEANAFASSLLMPAQLVFKAFAATNSIQKTARIFKVSPVAMSIRLAELGLVNT
ncbi:MAG: ImmA/IrrE family metallo-endopeptidase [Candidatus Saccharibacteria bacterium]